MDTITTPDPNLSNYAPNAFLGVDDNGLQWSTDNSGTPYISGKPTTEAQDQTWGVPNNAELGYGPGGDASSTSFTLGNVAQGINNVLATATAAIPATVNAVRNAKTAITAMNTPTPTSQWLQMPLQQQFLWIGAGILLVILAARGKL
jgi:hypothetical protein